MDHDRIERLREAGRAQAETLEALRTEAAEAIALAEEIVVRARTVRAAAAEFRTRLGQTEGWGTDRTRERVPAGEVTPRGLRPANPG